MITPKRVERTVTELHFDLPMDAREILDAINQYAIKEWGYDSDDAFWVSTDGNALIFRKEPR